MNQQHEILRFIIFQMQQCDVSMFLLVLNITFYSRIDTHHYTIVSVKWISIVMFVKYPIIDNVLPSMPQSHFVADMIGTHLMTWIAPWNQSTLVWSKWCLKWLNQSDIKAKSFVVGFRNRKFRTNFPLNRFSSYLVITSVSIAMPSLWWV